MAFEPLNSYGALSRAFDVFLLVVWIFMLAVMHLFPARDFFYFGGFAFVISVVSLRWPLVEGTGVLLLVAWVFGVFSKMPTGIIFWALFSVFCLLKIFLESIELKERLSVALLFGVTAFLFYIAQVIFLHQVTELSYLSFGLWRKVVEASFVEGLSGLVLGPTFLSWVSPR